MRIKFAYITCNLKPRSCSLALKIHSTATFLKGKPREEGHDFFIPKVFLQPLNSFEIIFRREINLHCSRSLHRSEFQDMCLFVYFLSPVVFADCRRTNINLTFSFQKRRMSREFIVRSLEVGKVWQESQVSGARAGSLFIISLPASE